MTHCSTFLEFTARLLAFIRSSERGIESEPAHVGGDQFNQLALALFALQFTHNAPYGRFCQARKVSPKTIGDWTEIPAISTSAFKELELTSLLPKERTTVFHSSGTTEQNPSRHFHSAESLAVYEASLLPWFAAQVLTDPAASHSGCRDERSPSPQPSPPGEGENPSARDPFKSRFRILSLTPPPKGAPHSSLVHMFETVRHEFSSPNSAFVGNVVSDGDWMVDVDLTIASLGRSRRREEADWVVNRTSPPPHVGSHDLPVVLLGTAFSFVHLLDLLAERNLRCNLPPGSRVLETGGYKGRSRELPRTKLHALISERLGIPASHIVCEYGMSELSSQAYDRIAGGGTNPQLSTLNSLHSFRFPPWARAQIISPETGHEVAEGETGLIRVFDLANVWSVMAIQTEDLGVRHGAGFELIGRAKTAEPRGCSLMTP